MSCLYRRAKFICNKKQTKKIKTFESVSHRKMFVRKMTGK